MMRPRDGTQTGRLARLADRLAHRNSARVEDSSLIWAAVAVLIVPDPDAILLIRRADRAGDPWSGHIALPGGRRESTDIDLLGTAIRESHEEVGVELDPEHLLGILEDVVPRTPVLPPVAVRPFVFLLPRRPVLVPNQEVASATWATLDDLLQPERHHAVRLQVAGSSREVQAYQLEDGVVWGMTERILSSLIQHLVD